MRIFIFIIAVGVLAQLGTYVHENMSAISLLEIGQVQKEVQTGWQFWNGKTTEEALFATFYNKTDGWAIVLRLWPLALLVAILCLLLLPVMLSLFQDLGRREARKKVKVAEEKLAKALERAKTVEKRALQQARSELTEQKNEAQNMLAYGERLTSQAELMKQGLNDQIQQIKWQAQQAINEANDRADLAEKKALDAESRKRNAAATAERRKRKLKKAESTS